RSSAFEKSGSAADAADWTDSRCPACRLLSPDGKAPGLHLRRCRHHEMGSPERTLEDSRRASRLRNLNPHSPLALFPFANDSFALHAISFCPFGHLGSRTNS